MADIPDIKQLKIGSTIYNLKDQGARDLIAALGSPMHFIGMSTTPLSDGATTNPIYINGQPVTAVSGDVATYTPSGQPTQEFIFTGSVWQLFGDVSDLGALAYHDFVTVPVPAADGPVSVSGAISEASITPQGTIKASTAGYADSEYYVVTSWSSTYTRYASFVNAQILVDALLDLDELPAPGESLTISWTYTVDWSCSITDLDNPQDCGWEVDPFGTGTLTLTLQNAGENWDSSYAPIAGQVELSSIQRTFVERVTFSKNPTTIDVPGQARDTTYAPATSTVQVTAISYSSTDEQLIFNNLFYYGPVGQPADSTFNMVTGISATVNSVAISAAIPSDSVVINGSTMGASVKIPSSATFRGDIIKLSFQGAASTHSHDIKLAPTNISGSSTSN